MRTWITMTLLAFALPVFSQPYNYYYGNIHAHSGYSDGSKDSTTTGIGQPGPAYRFAKNSYNFHFLGISEHNHSGAGMQLNDYAKGVYQADTANQNGTFVCMYGMEYGVINNGGHVLVYGVDSLIGWETNNYRIYCGQYDYATLWKLIARRPKAFATVAHPSDDDFSDLANTAFIDTADIAIAGAPMRSGSAFSTTTDYSDGAPGTVYDTYWRKLLSRGYHLGPTIDHDNHYTTFGRTAQSRTVVLASVLNRDSIMDAYRKMRFYASDDWNVKVTFTVNAYPMGSIFNSTTNPVINVQVTDPDVGDNVSNMQVYYGVPGSSITAVILTSASSSATLNYTHTISTGETYYYYAVITQADGNKIWTSPIWVTKTSAPLPVSLLRFTGNVKDNAIRLNALFSEGAYDKIVIEKGFRGNDFSSIGAVEYRTLADKRQLNFTDVNPVDGMQYYRLRFVDQNGKAEYSTIIAVDYNNRSYGIRGIINGNQLQVWATSAVDVKGKIRVYDAAGMQVAAYEAALVKGTNQYRYTLNGLSRGNYHVVIQLENGVQREVTISKM